MKIIFKLLSIFAFLFVSLLLMWCSESTQETVSESYEDTQIVLQPDRKNDLYWKILSFEGNEYNIQVVDTSKDPTFDMSTRCYQSV